MHEFQFILIFLYANLRVWIERGKFLCVYTELFRPGCFLVSMVKYNTGIVIFNLCFNKLALALILSFHESRKTILWLHSEKRNFREWQLNKKKELNQKANLQQKVLPNGIAWEFIYKSHTGKHYKIQQLIRLNGDGNSQRIA